VAAQPTIPPEDGKRRASLPFAAGKDIARVAHKEDIMTRSSLLLGIAGLAMLSTAAPAATLFPVVPVAGSTFTGPFGINNSNTIVGNWYDANSVEHGFFGSLAGVYTTFDYSGNTAAGTEPRGINDKNMIVGFGPTDGTGNYIEGPSFEYDGKTGKITTITEKGTPIDGATQGINTAGTFAGDHFVGGNANVRYGYLGAKSKWEKDLKVFGSTGVAARGINTKGVLVGAFTDSNGYAHGFIQDKKVTTQVDFPAGNEQQTFLEGINDKGVISGEWLDNSGSGLPYAFELDTKTNTFTAINVSGSTYQQAFGINNAGLIAINSDVGEYIYCPGSAKKCPGSNAVEVPAGRSITVPGGGWLHLAGRIETKAAVSHVAASPAKHGPGAPAAP
jgi:hypothetical protein